MNKPKLMDLVREQIRLKHYSIRTEQAYTQWIRRFILFHNKRHPEEMGASEISSFLSYLAQRQSVAAGTQNQALNALVFLYKQVLDIDVQEIEGVVKAKRPERLPVVFTREEVRAVLVQPGLFAAGAWEEVSKCGAGAWLAVCLSFQQTGP